MRLKEKKRYYFDSQSWNKYKYVLLLYSLANLPPSFVLPWPFALSHTAGINRDRLLFSQIQNPSAYIWNTMIRGYSEAKMGRSGFLFFCQMLQNGAEMDCRSFVTALKACGEQILRVLGGTSVHCGIRKMGFVSAMLFQDGLARFYDLRGCLGFA